MRSQRLENVCIRLCPLAAKLCPLPRTDIYRTLLCHCNRCQTNELFCAEPFLPLSLSEIKPFRRQRFVRRRHHLFQRVTTRVVIVDNLREAFMGGVFSKVLQRYRRTRQIVEDRFKPVMEKAAANAPCLGNGGPRSPPVKEIVGAAARSSAT